MARAPAKHKTVEKDLRQYLDLDVDQRRSDIVQRRTNFTAEIRKKDPTRAAITFKSFIVQERIVGLHLVARGDAQGWISFDRFLFANWVAARVDLPESGYPAATNLLHARSIGLEWMVRESAKKVASDLQTGFFANPTAPHRQRWRLPRFALWIAERNVPPDAPYDLVTHAWRDPIALATALTGVCEHHLSETPWASKLVGAEFANYSTQPIEVWAVEKTRLLEGLSTPTVDHPLMRTAFATRPPSRYDPSADDDLQSLLHLLGIDIPTDSS
ncbi:MAG: hypothetical protein J0L92_28815 [Deltaproteobacteria bacterium]|nr:hypothetical protein [Deltaproteobacteria bacterium]